MSDEEIPAMNRRHGRLVQSFVIDDLDGKAMPLTPSIGQEMAFECSYHGDRDEHWIVVRTVAAHTEIARFNVRYVRSIHWKP